MSRLSTQSGPAILAAGEGSATTYAHVGYFSSIDPASVSVPRYPGAGGLTWAGLALVLLLLWTVCRRGLARSLPVAGVCLLIAGQVLSAQTDRVPRRGIIEAFCQIEALAADTEAEAMRLGRWPTPEEWHRRHGWPRSPLGLPIHYQPGAPPNPWVPNDLNDTWGRVGIWAGPAEPKDIAGIYGLDSRLFGDDGLFGTQDDQMWLSFIRPSRYGKPAWPHARAPRDPKVKLPAWPAEPTQKRSSAGAGQ